MSAPLEPLRDPALRPYLNDVYAWHGYLRFLGLPTLQDNPDTPMQDLFVPPLVAEQPASADSAPAGWPRGESVLSALKESRRLVVLGEPGGGKSTLVNWLAWLLVAGVEERVPEWLRGMIPLPLILRELELVGVQSFDDLLRAFLKRPVAEHWRGREERLRELLEQGRVLVLADGLDEVGAAQRQGLRRALWEGFDLYPDCPFLLTSRVVGYEDSPVDRELYEALERAADEAGADEPWFAWAKARRLSGRSPARLDPVFVDAGLMERQRADIRHILPFDDERIRDFARNWYRLRSLKPAADSAAEDFIAQVFRDEATHRLARSPQLLTLMALVFRVRAQLPDGRALLYDLITEAYLESIDKSRQLSLSQDPYPWREKRRWLARVGFELQARRTRHADAPTDPAADPAAAPPPADSGRELLASRDEVRAWVAAAMQTSGYAPDAGFIDQYLDWLARRSGLFLPRGEGQYAFVHLSFQEYAAALYLVEHLTDPDWVIAQRDGTPYPDADPRITAATLREWAKDLRWQETLVFTFECFAHQPKDARRLVGWLFGEGYEDFCANLKPEYPEPAEAPRAELLARVLTNVHTGLGQAEREVAFEAVWRYLDEAEGRFSEIWGWFEKAGALNRLLAAEIWAASFWRRVKERQPIVLNLSGVKAELDAGIFETLPKLRQLALSDTALSDLRPLAVLRQLEKLWLVGSDIRDLTPLVHLSQLNHLGLFRVSVADLRPLSALLNLERLWLFDIPEAAIRTVGALTSLLALDLLFSPVSDLAPISGCRSLTSLWLHDLPVTDLSPLIGLAELKRLELDDIDAPIPDALLQKPGLEIIVDGEPVARPSS